MHPEVRQIGPGSCPICGMALEPEMPTAEPAPNAELADMTRRFWYGLALALPVFALEMGGHLAGSHAWLGQTTNWIELILATPVVLWAGLPFFVRGWHSVVSRNLNMFTLIAMGTGVAWLYSVVATSSPDFSRRRCAPRWRGSRLFRSGGSDRRARFAWTGPRAPGTRTDRRRRFARCSISRRNDGTPTPRRLG